MVQGGLSLGLYIALAHALPTAAFTACATALGVVVIAQAAGDFGLSQAVIAVLPNPASLHRPFARRDLDAGVALAFLLAGAAAIVLCLLAAGLVPGAAAAAVLAVAPAAAVAVAVAGTDGMLRAEGEFRRPVIIVAASRLGSFAGLPAAASGSATATCLGISAGTVVCSVPALRLLLARLRGGDPRATVGPFAGAAAPLGIANVAIVASARLNTVLLGGFASLRAAAVFEGAWRLFQVGQYAVGAAPTAAGPFIAHALGRRERGDLGHALRRAALIVAAAGGLFAVLLIGVRVPLDRALFGALGPPISRSLLWLAPVLPINLLALLMTITLAAASGVDRRWIAAAYFVGAAFNVTALLATAPGAPEVAGAVGAAVGVVATTVVLGARLLAVMRSLPGRR
ncbi:MAG: lipopolysaccharide biosynthesis protein [Solirubrobacteraceae bacterium]